MIIKTIPLRRLRNAEYIQYLQAIVGIINASSTAKAAVLTWHNALNAAVEVLNTLYINDPASPLSDDLAALDATRDRLMTGLVLVAKALTYGPDAEKAELARTLSRALEIYGDRISIQGYNAETTTIENIITDLTTKAELVEAVSGQALGTWVTALETANTSFKTMYAERTAAIAAVELSTGGASLTEQRGVSDDAWKALRRKVQANYELADGAEPWATVVAQINVLTDEYNATLLSREGRAAADHEGEEFPGS